MSMSARRRRNKGPMRFFRRCALGTLVFGTLWWLLVEGNMASWPMGAPVIATAVIVSMMIDGQYAPHWQLRGLLKFFLYFLWKSGAGAVDVAQRAFHPRLPLKPAFRTYQLRMPDDQGKVFFANVVSLLPGTLSAEVQPEKLVIHVLDENRPHLHELRALEERVGNIYGYDLRGTEAVE